jgi:DUF2075 family protein
VSLGPFGEHARDGWNGTVREFLELSQGDFLAALSGQSRHVLGMGPDSLQVEAWRNEHRVLQYSLADAVAISPRAANWHVVFEYELPRERGRRPDVLLLTGSQVIVLEFKDAERALSAHVDQVAAYSRDLSEYHAASHDKIVDPVLVLTRSTGREVLKRESSGLLEAVLDPRETPPSPFVVLITGPARLSDVLVGLEARTPSEPIGALAWLRADYDPLPSLVVAARRIFDHEELPHIRRAQSAGIPTTVEHLVQAADRARALGERHLALVTGVPGSGKTLVGLQFVYQNHFGDAGAKRTAVFLSGNGPLVKVLKYVLRSGIFVQDVHAYLKDYGAGRMRTPEEHVWVYDEAQRAWDAEQAAGKNRPCSEPEDFLMIGRRKPWALMVGLVGEGQEIHLGEEGGLSQWNDAIAATGASWVVHCPTKLAGIFTAASRVESDDSLNLTMSLRTHVAEDVQRWVERLLEAAPEAAGEIGQDLQSQGFDLYLTRELDTAKRYARERYAGHLDRRYGLLASSKARLEEFGIDAGYVAGQKLQVHKWFYDDPGEVRSCCQLLVPASEFQCQGLELDLPIVCWGKDLWWGGASWETRPSSRSRARDPHQLRLNSYRVLLTRGRDGVVVWIPKGYRSLDQTFATLRHAGFRQLD